MSAGDMESTFGGVIENGRPWVFGGRHCQRGRDGVFGWRLGQDYGVNALKGQRIFCESGAGRTVFHVIYLAVPRCVTDGTEAENVVYGVVHVNDHGGGEEEVTYGVIIVVCAAWLGEAVLCRLEWYPEGWDVYCVTD